MSRPQPAPSPLAAAISAALVLALSSGGAHAAHFVASSFADDAEDPTTLRGAICAANANADAFNSIELLPGSYLLTLAGAGEDDCATGDLDVHKGLTIVGAGADASIVDATGLGDRVFDLHGDSAIAVILQGLAITGGEVEGAGAGVHVAGAYSVTLDAVEISNNHTLGTAYSHQGGGVFADGEPGSVLQLSRSTVAENSAGSYGGAMMVVGEGSLVIRNSTIADNTSTGSVGPGLVNFSSGTSRIVNSTVTGNRGAYAPGMYVSTNLHLESSIVAGNVRVGLDTYTEIVTGTGLVALNNVIGRADNSVFQNGVNGNLVGAQDAPLDAGLAAIAYNGGPTRTVALEPWSVARENGSNPDGLSFDQRGEGWPRSVNVTDSGAYELGPGVFSDGFEDQVP